ncbi:response regulator [Bacillus marinisedimentorum]|uniref:response regulator n=1 Tax=Bacillus marinisedimentorum TaxID=1821260 RepID=UPI0007DEF6DB|nr:response regulator [Bacillus marinisedimentorum]
MISILIVDDEAIERQALQMILGGLPDIRIAGSAQNGRVAVEKAAELEPDLVLMDIKMPALDGVEAVKVIKKTRPQTRFIMVTAFDTFEYAREVMQQGVKEYLLKPSKRQDVLEAVGRMKEEILAEREAEQEQERIRKEYERALVFGQTEWVSSLLMDHIQAADFEEWSRLLGIDVNEGHTVVFSFGKDGGVLPKDTRRWLYGRLRDLLAKHAGSLHVMPGPATGNQVPVLCLFDRESVLPAEAKASVIQLVRITIESFKASKESVRLYAGIGNAYQSIDELARSYHEAISALQGVSAEGPVSYAYSANEAAAAVDTGPAFAAEKKLLDDIHSGDASRSIQQFDVYFTELEARSAGKPEKMKSELAELAVLMKRLTAEIGIEAHYSPWFAAAGTKEELHAAGKAFIKQISENVKRWRADRSHNVLIQAKEYILEHFRQPVTLEEVADHIDMNPFYVSKTFKERFGLSFIDYVTDLRINEARKLMLDTRKSLKEICFEVGYKDPNYFSRVFKKKVGQSPREYRGQEQG